MATIYYLAAIGVLAVIGIIWGSVKLHRMNQEVPSQAQQS